MNSKIQKIEKGLKKDENILLDWVINSNHTLAGMVEYLD